MATTARFQWNLSRASTISFNPSGTVAARGFPPPGEWRRGNGGAGAPSGEGKKEKERAEGRGEGVQRRRASPQRRHSERRGGGDCSSAPPLPSLSTLPRLPLSLLRPPRHGENGAGEGGKPGRRRGREGTGWSTCGSAAAPPQRRSSVGGSFKYRGAPAALESVEEISVQHTVWPTVRAFDFF